MQAIQLSRKAGPMPLPPSLYRIAEPRLRKARHYAANALQRACANGHRRTAEQWARVVATCDHALGTQQHTPEGWRTLVHELLQYARPRRALRNAVAMDDVLRARGSE